jgi:eukaryotic-like serine/threonine-protein kinase
VQYAHQRGVLHRDLKSANILVDAAGEPHLTDFGIAKLAQEESGLTRTMDLLGTPGYMAPELAGDSTASVASDVYSLGVVLYELLTGHLPFEAKGTAEMLRQIREVEPRPPAGINAEVHPDLQTICLKCLAKEPDRRYPNAAGLAEDLRRYIRNEPIQARPASARERLWRWSRRKPALAATLALLGMVSGLGLSAVFWQWQRAERLSAAEARERQRAESALQQLRLDGADTLLAEGENALAMAHLGQALRQTPDQSGAAYRLMSALMHSEVPLLVREFDTTDWVEFSPTGRWLATASSAGQIRLWEWPGSVMVFESPIMGAPVVALRFSSRDDRLLAAFENGAVCVWSTGGERIAEVELLKIEAIRRAAFDPGGQRLATIQAGGEVRVTELISDGLRRPVLPHPGPVEQVGFSPDDGRRLFTVDREASVWVWQAASGKLEVGPMRHDAAVVHAEFDANGRRLLTALADGTAWLWDLENRRATVSPYTHEHRLSIARFSPQADRIVTASWDVTARIWRIPAEAPVGEPMRHRHWVMDAAFSPDGRRVLTASEDGTARLWDADTGEPRAQPMWHPERLRTAGFSPDGRWVATTSADGLARVWDVRSRLEVLPVLRHSGWIRFAQFSPDGQRILTASEDGSARVWDAGTARPLTPYLRHEQGIWSACWSPDGQSFATAARDGLVRLWRAADGEPWAAPLEHNQAVRVVAYSPDGRLLLTGTHGGSVHLWEATGGRHLAELMRQEQPILAVGFSPDGGRGVAAGEDGSVRILSTRGELKALGLLKHRRAVWDARFSPDGRCLATACTDGFARLWDVEGAALLGPVLRHGREVSSVRFSADGRKLATASHDGMARVWSLESRQLICQMVGHRHWVWSAEFSPDARWVVTASEDGSARVWDGATGQPVSEALRHQRFLRSAGFSPDGRRVITASADGTARVWDMPPLEFPVPAWLPALAEAAGGLRFNAEGAVEGVPARTIEDMRRLLPDPGDRSRMAEWLRRFLADRFERDLAVDSTLDHGATSPARGPDRGIAPGIGERAPGTPPALVDLSDHYLAGLRGNWHGDQPDNDLSELPAGIARLAGVDFDVRGLIQLDPVGGGEGRFPIRVLGMRVGQSCERLHFLHAAIHGNRPPGLVVGSYVLRYADGTWHELPIVLGEQVRDWFASPDEPALSESTCVAWTGWNGKSRRFGTTIRLFKTTWSNPRPDLAIETIDFVSKRAGVGPFLVAITVE